MNKNKIYTLEDRGILYIQGEVYYLLDHLNQLDIYLEVKEII